jgi:hypothetical protein
MRKYNFISILELMIYIQGKENMLQDWKKSLLLYLFVSTVIKVTVVIIKAYYCYELHTVLKHSFKD